MIPLEKLKKLMPKDREYSDEEIIKIGKNMEDFAQLIFDDWLENRKNKT